MSARETKRSSGILLPLFALPSKYGTGSLGLEARAFVEFLGEARQRWWQILPINPINDGNSPYQSFSTFAGEPCYIDLEALVSEGLLTADEVEAPFWGEDEREVDYKALKSARPALLRKAFERGYEREKEAVERFCEENAFWLEDYALYMALKSLYGEKCWYEWPEALRHRRPLALKMARGLLIKETDFRCFEQYLFFKQWDALKRYANERGVGIIGDLPIYLAMDSADVWARPECFLLDEKGHAREVSGVPPDYFSEDGQLWGNPLYDWEHMKKNGYEWWAKRIAASARLFDGLRLDHFRAFESYWAVDGGETTAKNGRWVKGPGMEIIDVIKRNSGDCFIIAEDLGCLSDGVRELLERSGFPGMKVLQFAFDPNEESTHLPHFYGHNCVCYTGTHDNATLAQWLKSAPRGVLDKAKAYLKLNEEEGYARGVLRAGMSSEAGVFIAPIQDYLELGEEARINVPGTVEGNWKWRLKKGEANSTLASSIAEMTLAGSRA